jgi:AcrR family transcriptional regulator
MSANMSVSLQVPTVARLGLTGAQLDRLQRARIAQAVAELAVGRTEEPAVAEIVSRAATSRRTFYRLFVRKQDALLAACELRLEEALRRLAVHCGETPPAEQVQAAIVELLGLVDEHRVLVRRCLGEGADTEWLVMRIAPWLDRACDRLGLEPALPGLSTVEVVAGITGLIKARVATGNADARALLPAVQAMAVRPAARAEGGSDGPGPARLVRRLEPLLDQLNATRATERRKALSGLRELAVDAVIERDAPTLGALQKAVAASLRSELPPRERAMLGAVTEVAAAGMRAGPGGVLAAAGLAGPAQGGVGHQALRCLSYVAEHPGATGQQVQAALGHRHLSQTTRVLAVLERRGLVTSRVTNTNARAWRATPKGRGAAGLRPSG